MDTKKHVKFVDCERHESAILHMIGECCFMRPLGVTVSEIAGYMNVSKPTAKRYLDLWCEEGKLKSYKRDFGVHGRWHYIPTTALMDLYEAGAFKDAYELYAQRILKVII